MIFTLATRTRYFRALAKRVGYIAHTRRLSSRVIPVVMNDELKELQARRRALIEMYSNKPDPDWIGTASPEFSDEESLPNE